MTDFHSLYTRHASHVRRFALYLCGDPELAGELTSETFMRAWAAHERLRPASTRAYLFGITRNLYVDSLRHRRRHTPLHEALADRRESVEHRADVDSELRVVLAALQQLPEIDRAALLMRAQEEMSYVEIGHALGLSVTNARVRVHRARLKLMGATGLGGHAPRRAGDDA